MNLGSPRLGWAQIYRQGLRELRQQYSTDMSLLLGQNIGMGRIWLDVLQHCEWLLLRGWMENGYCHLIGQVFITEQYIETWLNGGGRFIDLVYTCGGSPVSITWKRWLYPKRWHSVADTQLL